MIIKIITLHILHPPPQSTSWPFSGTLGMLEKCIEVPLAGTLKAVLFWTTDCVALVKLIA